MRRIFISHSYQDGDLYLKLIGELRRHPNFFFQDRSVPDTRLIETKNVRRAIKRNISESDVMLIFTRPITGMRPMIKFEIETAKKLGKPIIAIKPTESRNVSRAVRQAADILIDWDIEEIVRQIRNPGTTPMTRPSPATEVNDTANVPTEIVSPPATPSQTTGGFKKILKHTFGFRRRFRRLSATPSVLGVVEIDENADRSGLHSAD